MRAALALALVAACKTAPPVERIATPREGIAMSFYRAGTQSFTVVDDRRRVEVRGGQLLLDRVDPGAALPSLVIEPLAGPALAVGPCDRETGSPLVRCTAASGGDGERLVRVLYVSSTLSYTAQHAALLTGAERATIETRFAIATPAWAGRAEVVLFEGLPGSDTPPVELARGTLALDGSTAVLGAPPREVAARVRRVFDGARRAGVGDSTDPAWGKDSVHAVWVWLELDGVMLAPGATRAHLELPGEAVRDIDVPAAGREHVAGGTRLPLWIDEDLRGHRQRSVMDADGASLTDRLSFSVSNVGETPREVWIEERLRTAKRATLGKAWPERPSQTREVVRAKVVVKPGGTERLGFAIDYVF